LDHSHRKSALEYHKEKVVGVKTEKVCGPHLIEALRGHRQSLL
jgi:hypothetical protein